MNERFYVWKIRSSSNKYNLALDDGIIGGQLYFGGLKRAVSPYMLHYGWRIWPFQEFLDRHPKGEDYDSMGNRF
jgi:hypothetical protein